jgi:hypothetical protein
MKIIVNREFFATYATALVLCMALPSQAQSRYVPIGAGDEVHDTQTGLIWKRCSEGQTWGGVARGCVGRLRLFLHWDALSHAREQSGAWRVPNRNELLSLVDRRFMRPVIDSQLFPDTPANDWYWTSTPSHTINRSEFVWAVYFGHGSSLRMMRSSTLPVRLVRRSISEQAVATTTGS